MTEKIHNDRRISLQEVCEYPEDKSNTVMVVLISVACLYPKSERFGVSKPFI